MGLFKNIKQGLEASKAALSGEYAGPTEEQLAALTPEQRAQYEANMASVAEAREQQAAEQHNWAEQERARRALHGPAGEHVYGALPDMSVAPTVEGEMAKAKEQFKDVLRNPFGARKAPLPPSAPAGAVDRTAQAAAERAARDAAREPYLAPDRPALSMARLATRAKTQLEEVAAYLGSSGLAAHPELVFGVYRVPDHIGGGVLRGGTRVVEWDVVHAAPAQDVGDAPAATVASFDASERWVSKRDGEPSLLDEDLALAYLAGAGLGPERCLGIARGVAIREHSQGEGGSSWVLTQVTGVHVFHPAGLGAGVLEQMRAQRPLTLAPHDVRVEVLNWGAIARAVHPERHRRFLVPSPFPYLPSTAQELLRAYLEVVGVRPEDSYSAQVTEDDARDIMGVSQKGFMTVSTNRGEEQPCADGKSRPRLAGGARVVVAYRDAPAYVEGRERWAAYERDVLQAALANGTKVRRPVVGPGRLERGKLGRVLRAAENVHDFVEGIGDDPFEDITPFRYCWPPQQ